MKRGTCAECGKKSAHETSYFCNECLDDKFIKSK